MSDYIEIQNKINFKNIAICGMLALCGTINGLLDFKTYQTDIGKIMFPTDSVMFTKVVELNQSMLETNEVLNNTGTAFNFIALAVFVLVAIFIVGMVGGCLGKGCGSCD